MQAGADTDAALIEASHRRDCDAFARIIERHQRAVYAMAFSSVRDRALADDITQETFVVAWRRLAELRDSARLRAWLCGIARNLGRDARKRRQRETLGDSIDIVGGVTPYEALSDAESERIVATALGQVPDVYREPLVLYYYEEHSIDDVARSLGISAATTNKRLSRGRQCLAERVANVEQHLTRRGPRPGLAASVLAIIGIPASASHVDASPGPLKGSTMHKLAIAAVVTATLGGAGVLVATTRSDAHAKASSAGGAGKATHDVPSATPSAASGHGADCSPFARTALAPSLATLLGRADNTAPGTTTAASIHNDCAAVGRHLAELEADTTHGPATRPDEATCEKCASHYANQCESQAWTAERRTCALAAGDLVNAHLCAGDAKLTTSAEKPNDVPAALTCTALAKHIADTVQSAGIYTDVTDMPQQVEAACEMGNWAIELRRCFEAASSVMTLQTCIDPAAT